MKVKRNILPGGPKGELISGCADEFRKDALGFLTRCQSEFGDLVLIPMGPYRALLVNDLDMIQTILVTDAQNFTKDAALKNNRAFFGNGLLSSEGDLWKRQRKLASAAFSSKRLEIYSQTMAEHAFEMVADWHDGEILDVTHEMMRLTLRIATKTLFDAEINQDEELEEALTEAQKQLSIRMNDPILLLLPEWVPFPTNVHLHKAIEKVDKVVYELIERRRGKAEGRDDLLSILISAKDDDGASMGDKQVRDEIFTMFFAGHETTALTLSWTLYLLSLNPEVEAKLLAELKQVLNGRHPQIADCFALPYIEKVIKESMRILPPVWAIGREAANECMVADYVIEKGTAILLSQWLMHRDKRFYKDPEMFNPDRWTAEFSNNLPKFAYFPFGGGARICIGNNFAMLEAMLALAIILQNYHIKLLPDHPVELLPAVTLRPAHGIKAKLVKRS